MNLVKWFRKNNKKLMAIVVIVLMIGFVGGTALQQLLSGRAGGLGQTEAYYGEGEQITRYALVMARQELEILKALGADMLLRNLPGPRGQTVDLHGMFLGELLFSDRTTSPAAAALIKQSIATNQYSISIKQVNEMYNLAIPNYVYWLLLTKEAEQAGIRISNESFVGTLARLIPQLTGVSYNRSMNVLVGRFKVPEEQLLATFGKLLAVLSYSRWMCGVEEVTARQIQNDLSTEAETINVEFVRFESSVFARDEAEPSEEQIQAQFEKYKQFAAGQISEENPYGFGYRQPDRVRLEYIALKLDEVGKQVPRPTQEEMQEFYHEHEEQFVISVPLDANDPNSEVIERRRSYAEVANTIYSVLRREKKNTKAEQILQEARALTEPVMEGPADEPEPSSEQLKQAAGDYGTPAEQLKKKHNISIYTGLTGWLSADNMLADRYLGQAYVRGYSNNPVSLTDVAFAVKELGAYEIGQFDAPKPRLFENIGPVRDASERFVMLVRVTEFRKAGEPKSMNLTFSTTTVDLGEPDANSSQSEKVYSVMEKVTEEVNRLAAMETTKSKAEEFMELAVSEGWESAIETFNNLYGADDSNDGDANAPAESRLGSDSAEPFRLQTLSQLRRFSRRRLETLAVQGAGNPLGPAAVLMAKKEGKLRQLFYSLVPEDGNSVETTPLVVEFKPDLSYYVVKSLSVNRLSREAYEILKSVRAFQADVVSSQSLAAVHFNPENIAKRVGFRWARQAPQPGDANAPTESKEPS